MPRKYRSHRRHLGQAESGGINWKNPWVWGSALAAVGHGVFFWSRKKSASVAKLKDVSTPTGDETGADTAGGATGVIQDPGTGVPVVGPAGALAPVASYVVQKGESWANIASRTYGDFRWWPALWDANRTGGTQYKDPSLLRVGDTIKIPDLPSDAAFKAAIFARATVDREWELAKKQAKKKGQTFTMPRPASTFAATPVPAVSAPPGSSVSPAPEPITVAPALNPHADIPAPPPDELEQVKTELTKELEIRREEM